MSWFDKLFGEQDNPNKDYLNKRSHRRQKPNMIINIRYYLKIMIFMNDLKVSLDFQCAC